MIQQFADSALVIDDSEKEGTALVDALNSNGIMGKWVDPNQEEELKKVPKLVFLDLHIDNTITETEGSISKIRGLLQHLIKQTESTYGIVLWTSHPDEVDKFKGRIVLDKDKYTIPLFVLSLNKGKYLSIEHSFSSLITDLDKEINNNAAVFFSIFTSIEIDKSKNKVLQEIYSLVPYYSPKQNINLQFILFEMARNRYGIPKKAISAQYPFLQESVKAIIELLSEEAISIPESILNPFNCNSVKYEGTQADTSGFSFINDTDEYTESGNRRINKKSESLKPLKKEISTIFTKINSTTFLESNPTGDSIISGNIYEVKSKYSPLYIKAPVSSDVLTNNDLKDENFQRVAIVMNPPCDFCQDNLINQRLLGGFIVDNLDCFSEKFKAAYYYKELNPVLIDQKEKLLIFDFRYLGLEMTQKIEKGRSYSLILRAKSSFFADILQKMTSHSSRLGIAALKQK